MTNKYDVLNDEKLKWIPVSPEKTALTEDLECPYCGGHVKLDLSYLHQESDVVFCPYCTRYLEVGEEVYDEGGRSESDPLSE